KVTAVDVMVMIVTATQAEQPGKPEQAQQSPFAVTVVMVATAMAVVGPIIVAVVVPVARRVGGVVVLIVGRIRDDIVELGGFGSQLVRLGGHLVGLPGDILVRLG